MYDELVKKVNAIEAGDPGNLFKNGTIAQKLLKLKKKYLIMVIMISISLYKNLIS